MMAQPCDISARQAVAVDPALLLEGDRPRLLDEWQAAPQLWNHVRRAVDASDGFGHFILTGSAVPAEDVEQIRAVDISRVGGARRDPARVGAVLASLARNVATEVKNSVLAIASR